ncbi:MAG: hypothetical protein ACYTHM_18255, partial [Planctomycetota bacterium]
DGKRGRIKESYVRPTSGYEAQGYGGKSISIVDTDPKREAFMAAQIRSLEGNALLTFFGHGSPIGVQHGYTGKALNQAKLNIFPALVVSCACYTGTVHAAYMESQAGVRKQTFAEGDLFALALIHAGATGFFAGVGPWHGCLATEVRDFCLLRGLPAGEAARRMYNRLALAWGKERLKFDPMKDGAPTSRDSAHIRKFTPANMVYLGDPASRPFPPKGESPIEVKVVESESTRVVLRLTSIPRRENAIPWIVMSYHLGDRRLHEASFFTPLPPGLKKIKAVSLHEAKSGGTPVQVELDNWLLEEHDGKHFLHVVLACDANTARRLGMTGLKADLVLTPGK